MTGIVSGICYIYFKRLLESPVLFTKPGSFTSINQTVFSSGWPMLHYLLFNNFELNLLWAFAYWYGNLIKAKPGFGLNKESLNRKRLKKKWRRGIKVYHIQSYYYCSCRNDLLRCVSCPFIRISIVNEVRRHFVRKGYTNITSFLLPFSTSQYEFAHS